LLRRSPIAIAAASIAGLGLFGLGPALANTGPADEAHIPWKEILPTEEEPIERAATALSELDPELLNSRAEEPSPMEGDALAHGPLTEDETPAESSTEVRVSVTQPSVERAPARVSAGPTPKRLRQAAPKPARESDLAGLYMPWERQADDGSANTPDSANAEPAVHATTDGSAVEAGTTQPTAKAKAESPNHSERVLQQLATMLDASSEASPPSPKPPAPSEVDRVLETLAAVLMPVDIELDLSEAQHAQKVEPIQPAPLQADARLADDPRIERDANVVVAISAEATSKQPPPVFATAAVDPSRLESMRGGFITNDGLRVSFGIERAVYINGNLVTTTSLNVSELGRMSGGAAPASTISSPAAQGTLAVIQNGGGNMTVSNAAGATLGTVIQNNLNDQKIQTLTVINAVVNSLQVMRSMNMQQSMRSAVIDSLRR
jgi:hypothetical protein